MEGAKRDRIARELPPGRWTPDNHRKLVDCVASHAGGPPSLALFDADHTSWGGDLGDATLIHLLRNLRLSPRLHTVLPEVIDVPAEGFGVTTPGRLFPAARVEASLAAMLTAYRRRVAPSATLDELVTAFSEPLIQPGGPLHGDGAFATAHAIYSGTLVALYNLLETTVGCVAFDFEDVQVATPLFAPPITDFYAAEAARGGELSRFTRRGPGGSTEVLFPAILDTGPDQATLRARGRLGAYTQIAAWEALDKTPDELGRLALEVWESPREDTRVDAVFPVDHAAASSPAPLDLTVDPAHLAPGARLAGGVVLGTSFMLRGTRKRPEIADLWAVMARHGVVPVVITASHVDLVRAVLDRHYGFAGLPLIGMLPVLHGGRYGADLMAPATYRTGKVDSARLAARQVTGSDETRPLLCAGDTNTDLEMLAYSGGYRLFFDRGKRPLMDLAEHLAAGGEGERTLVQAPF